MEPQVSTCGTALTDMEIKARELSKNGGLRSYLVVLREMKTNPKGELVATVRSMCFTAPSFSHVAAKYDHPEDGVEIMKQEFLAMGEVSVLPLAYKGMMSELLDLSGLNMCYNCIHDFRQNPLRQGADELHPAHVGCKFGHRINTEPATTICRGFSPKVP
jgi:hypothetical protein